METARQRLENLLRRAALDTAYVPELQRALQPVKVICLGAHIADSMQRPWTQLNGCQLAGELVLPCFLSRRALRVAQLDDMPVLLVAFPDFVRAAQGYGVPIVIDMKLHHTYTIPPEQFHLFYEKTAFGVLHGNA